VLPPEALLASDDPIDPAEPEEPPASPEPLLEYPQPLMVKAPATNIIIERWPGLIDVLL